MWGRNGIAVLVGCLVVGPAWAGELPPEPDEPTELLDREEFDLALRNESGEILDASSSVTDNEQVGPLILFADQVLYVEVDLLGFGGDPPGNTYGIAILTEPLPSAP